MNQEYKQWKKILAHPVVLILQGVIMFTFIFLATNLLFNVIYNLKEFFSMAKQYAIGGSPNWSKFYSLSMLKINTQFPLFKLGYFIIGIISTYLVGRRSYDMRISFRDINKGTKGTERLTTQKEIAEQYHKVPLNNEEYEGHSGIPISSVTEGNQKFVYIDRNKTNSLTLGGTQSGKTEMFSYPFLDLIMRAKIKDSVIVNDLKGDMLKNTKAEFERFGYDVHCLNLVEPENGIRYNPLELVKKAYVKGNYTKAQMLANNLSFSLYHNPNSKEPMWEEASISLLNALILAICEIGVNSNAPQVINMYAVTSMLEELGAYPDEKGNTALDLFFDNLPTTSVARKQYGTIKFSQGITRSGIFTGTMAKLKNYTYDSIAYLTSESDFELLDLAYGKKPIALFIVYPDWNDSNYSIISTFLSQINDVLAETATLSVSNEGERRVHYLLEEAANIPAIDGLSRSMNVGLSRGLIYHLVVQSYAQLDDKYGEKMSKAITGACGNQIYIMSDEYEDAEYFSKKLGNKTVITGDRHGDPLSIDKSYGEREEDRAVLTTNELRKLKKGEWLVIRTKMREDLKGNRITPYPILACEKTNSAMQHRYEYLLERFDNPISLSDLALGRTEEEFKLEDIIVKFRTKVVEDNHDFNEADLEVNEKTIENSNKKIEEKNEFNQEVLEDMDKIDLNSPLLKDELSSDQYEYLKTRVEDEVSEEEYAYFLSLETINEVENFCNSDKRKGLQEAFNDILVVLKQKKEAINSDTSS